MLVKHTYSKAPSQTHRFRISRAGAWESPVQASLRTQLGELYAENSFSLFRETGRAGPWGETLFLVSYPINHSCHSGERKTRGKRKRQKLLEKGWNAGTAREGFLLCPWCLSLIRRQYLSFKPLQFFLSCKLLLSVAAGLIYMQYLELISIPGKQIPLPVL